MSRLGFRPISLDRHEAVIGDFFAAAQEDDREHKEFEEWQSSREQAGQPLLSNHVGAVTLKYAELGMPNSAIIILREAAYERLEVAEAGETND